jgi:hypothetical protein
LVRLKLEITLEGDTPPTRLLNLEEAEYWIKEEQSRIFEAMVRHPAFIHHLIVMKNKYTITWTREGD